MRLAELVIFCLVQFLGFLVEFIQVELSDDVLLVGKTDVFLSISAIFNEKKSYNILHSPDFSTEEKSIIL